MKSQLDDKLFIRLGSAITLCECGARIVQVLVGKNDSARMVKVDFVDGPMQPGPGTEAGHWGRPHKCPRRKCAKPDRLSLDLPHERHPNICQACGIENQQPEIRPFFRYREHNDWDLPTAVLVVLCSECAEELIEPHPRLYDFEMLHRPLAGSMNCCADCIYRRELECGNPRAKANGGLGVALKYPEPARAFFDYSTGKKGMGRGGHCQLIWRPPVTCLHREAKELETEEEKITDGK